MQDIFDVLLSSKTRKQLTKLPVHIVDKLHLWIDTVGHDGLREVRKISGYHDEPLSGKRAGQRSIRLSKNYRAIYVELSNQEIQFVEIIEVHNHDY